MRRSLRAASPAEKFSLTRRPIAEFDRLVPERTSEISGLGGQPNKPSFGIYLDFKPKLLSLKD